MRTRYASFIFQCMHDLLHVYQLYYISIIYLQTTEALARYAGAQKKPFNYMHCWKYLKDEPKWHEEVEKPTTSNDDEDCMETVDGASNQVDTTDDNSTPSSGNGKRPLGRDSSKASRKKTAESFASKMHELWSDRHSYMKETQNEKNVHLAHIAAIEKEKLDRQVELEKEKMEHNMRLEERRLAIEDRRLAQEEKEREARIVADEEQFLSIDLDTCIPRLRPFYKAQQDKILAKYTNPSSD